MDTRHAQDDDGAMRRSPDRPRAVDRWGLGGFTIGAIGGAIIGLVLAAVLVPDLPETTSTEVGHLPVGVVPLVLASAGVMIGLLVTGLVFTLTGQPRCPRCGTANDRRSEQCSSCDLALFPR